MRNNFRNNLGSIVCSLAIVAVIFAATGVAAPQGATVGTIAQLESEAILASGTLTIHDGLVDDYEALRFLLRDVGAGTMVITADWQTQGGTSIQAAAEVITLVSDYLEVPVRSPRVAIVITESSGTNPLDVTGAVIGVAR